jgi:hypothetical protein
VNFPRSGYAGSAQIVADADSTGKRRELHARRGRAGKHRRLHRPQHVRRRRALPAAATATARCPGSQLFQWGGLLQQSGLPYRRAARRQRPVRPPRVPAPAQGIQAARRRVRRGSYEIGRVGKPLVANTSRGRCNPPRCCSAWTRPSARSTSAGVAHGRGSAASTCISDAREPDQCERRTLMDLTSFPDLRVHHARDDRAARPGRHRHLGSGDGSSTASSASCSGAVAPARRRDSHEVLRLHPRHRP